MHSNVTVPNNAITGELVRAVRRTEMNKTRRRLFGGVLAMRPPGPAVFTRFGHAAAAAADTGRLRSRLLRPARQRRRRRRSADRLASRKTRPDEVEREGGGFLCRFFSTESSARDQRSTHYTLSYLRYTYLHRK